MQRIADQDSGWSILLVGLTAEQVEELRGLVKDREGCTVINAKNGAEALEVVGRQPVAAVVADAKLSDIEGVKFLDSVQERLPQVARILISDFGSVEATVHCVGTAHHHLSRPCDSATLLALIDRTRAFQSGLGNPRLPALLAKLPQLPSPPEIYFQVLEEVQSSDASVERIGELIMQDPALSAKILQLANSAVFGLQLQVIHPAEAVAYLGLEPTKALLLLAHTFSFFEAVRSSCFSLQGLQCHALSVGLFAQRIAEWESPGPEVQGQAFTAGLLHDVGKLLLAANLPDQYDQVLTAGHEQNRPLWEVELEVFGASHAEVGGSVLDRWHLPVPIVEAVTWHHSPGRSPTPHQTFTPLTSVHVANALEHEARPDSALAPSEFLDLNYLQEVSSIERLDDWRSCCQVRVES
jgi:HD-like signal output (HDOD) protein/ActR/RegA family two-component response regulator